MLQLLCANGLEFVLDKCNVNTFGTLDPSYTRHGILSEKLSFDNNGELSWIFLMNALWENVCWIQFNFKIVFDFLCFNSWNSRNESEGDCASVCEEKIAIDAIDLMDGHTIPFIQDAWASLTKDPLYHSGGKKWKITFAITTIRRWIPYMFWREFSQTRKMLENLYL